MTHEELLTKIHEEDSSVALFVGARTSLADALCAVVELHKPWETLPQLENPLVWCEVCQEDYPCPTIHAIEKELA